MACRRTIRLLMTDSPTALSGHADNRPGMSPLVRALLVLALLYLFLTGVELLGLSLIHI